VAIMQIVDVVAMSNSDMAAGESVLMAVTWMLSAGAHRDLLKREAD
jgi:hypothetical protein